MKYLCPRDLRRGEMEKYMKENKNRWRKRGSAIVIADQKADAPSSCRLDLFFFIFKVLLGENDRQDHCG